MLSTVAYSNGINYDYFYDGFSRLKQKDETIDDEMYSTHYTYDNLSRTASYTYPSGFALNYSYNVDGYGEAIYREDDNGAQLYMNGNYNYRGQLTDFYLGANIMHTEQIFEPVTGYPKKIITEDIQNLEFHFDPLTGNLKVREDKLLSLREQFAYNDAFKSRLTDWQVEGGPEYSIDYDPQGGSIEHKSDLGTYTYSGIDIRPHAVASIENPVQMPAEGYQEIFYTTFNKVEHIDHKEDKLDLYFTYGPGFNRKKTELYDDEILQQTKYFIGGNYEIEINEQGDERALHYIGSDAGLVAIYETINGKDSPIYFIHKDYLGSIQCISNEQGQVLETLSFDPWGNRRNPNDWNIDNPPQEPPLFDRGFTGHQHLDDFHLINMNGRVYDPILAQFLSPDNNLQAPGNSQNFNRYAYVLNNPFKYTDPDGEFVQFIMGALMGGYSGYMIADANGVKGLDKLWYTLAGAAIGAGTAGIGTSVTTSAGIVLGGIVSGAAGGSSFGAMSGYAAGQRGSDLLNSGLNGMWQGAITGLVGSNMGGSLGGVWGAGAGGFTTNITMQLLNNGFHFNQINLGSALLSAGISSSTYMAGLGLGYSLGGGNKSGDRKLSFRQYMARNRDIERSMYWQKEYGGFDMPNGSVKRWKERHSFMTKPNPGEFRNDAEGAYHTHWAKSNKTYRLDNNFDRVDIRDGSSYKVVTSKYHSMGDYDFKLPLTTINRYDGGSFSTGPNNGFVRDHNSYFIRHIMFPFNY